jgi:hypothetical protein
MCNRVSSIDHFPNAGELRGTCSSHGIENALADIDRKAFTNSLSSSSSCSNAHGILFFAISIVIPFPLFCPLAANASIYPFVISDSLEWSFILCCGSWNSMVHPLCSIWAIVKFICLALTPSPQSTLVFF